MTEAEWLACGDPKAMLWFLRDRAGGRKCRLFACACVRRAWHLLTEAGRALVTVVERQADGLTTDGEVEAARQDDLPDGTPSFLGGLGHIREHAPSDALGPASWAVRTVAEASGASGIALERPTRQEREAQASLLRDIFGNPFRKPERQLGWLTFQRRLVPKLALSTYRGQAFADLPILADALEDAGCADADILTHLRSPGPHVRGCWALDLILGRK